MPASDVVAVEMPVAIAYHGVPYAVMLATPADLIDFGYGFTLTESLVDSADEISPCRRGRPATAMSWKLP